MTYTDKLSTDQYEQGILGRLNNVDLSIATDQPIRINNRGLSYTVGGVFGTNANAAVTNATATIYTGSGKTGSTIGNLSTFLQSLTPGSTDWVGLLINSTGKQARSASTLYFACTATIAGKTCDILLFGGTYESSALSQSKTVNPFGTVNNGVRLLGVGKTINMNSTADQTIRINSSAQSYSVSRHHLQNGSTTFSGAAGGLYTGTGKTGTQVIVNSQTWALTPGTTDCQSTVLTHVAQGASLTNSMLYFSLTTGSGSASTADLQLIGITNL